MKPIGEIPTIWTESNWSVDSKAEEAIKDTVGLPVGGIPIKATKCPCGSRSVKDGALDDGEAWKAITRRLWSDCNNWKLGTWDETSDTSTPKQVSASSKHDNLNSAWRMNQLNVDRKEQQILINENLLIHLM